MGKGFNRKNNRYDQYCYECGVARDTDSLKGWSFQMHSYDEETGIHSYDNYWLCSDCATKVTAMASKMKDDARCEYERTRERLHDKEPYIRNLLDRTLERYYE